MLAKKSRILLANRHRMMEEPLKNLKNWRGG